MSIRLFSPGVTASTETRTLRGPVVRYGVPGRTSRGRLRVRPGALYVEGDVSEVKLTKEHNRAESRGHAADIEFLEDGIRAAMRVSDGPEGDAALREAQDRTRDGFSFDVIDEQIEGDEIVSGRIIAIGQVGIPAYDGMRIDSIAASLHEFTPTEGAPAMPMTPEQRARLAELLANTARTAEEETEFAQLVQLAVDEATAVTASDADADQVEETPAPVEAPAQPVGVAASMVPSVPSVPSGIPLPTGRGPARTQPQGGNAFDRMISGLSQAFEIKRAGGNPLPGITAALSDVTSTANTENVEPIGWSGELFSGVDYQPVFSDLLTAGPLTNWRGQGWRFTSTPSMADYAGDKTEIPSGTVATEDSLYEAARGAVGLDIDRKYFDFPNADFLAALFREIGGTWVELLDTKAKAFELTEAVQTTRPVTVTTTDTDATVTAASGEVAAISVGMPITGTGIPDGTTVLSITNATTFEMSANATASGTVVAELGVKSPSLLKAAARASNGLNRRITGSKAPSSTGADWILVNEEDYFGLLGLVNDALPAFLDMYGIDPRNFRPSADVTRGYVYAGVRRAATLRTENTPIVVDALNLANGGIDKAFYGYWAIEQHHLRGIQKVPFSAVIEG